jgi:D-3-phosphoglycerate dehydrogenase (EC 1.1.1.95)
VIGFIGSVLGDNDINIAGMFNARETIGGEALTVYNLDVDVPDDVVEQLLADDGSPISRRSRWTTNKRGRIEKTRCGVLVA